MNVSIVITNFNGLDLLKQNLPSVVSASKNKLNRIIEIIVVDDASTDESVKFIKSLYPNVKVIVHEINLRFAQTVNTGFERAKGDLVCLLNNDVSVTKNFIAKSLSLFENKDLFGISLAEEGYSWSKGIFDNGFVNHRQGKKYLVPHTTFWISGGSGLFRKSFWNKLGGLDSQTYTPFYWEDLDISYRAAKRGWELIWDPRAKVNHSHESTNKLFDPKYKQRIQERNQLLFIWKNITSSRMTRQHIRGLLRRTIRHPGYIRIILMALTKLFSTLRKRRIETKESKISDESIFAQF